MYKIIWMTLITSMFWAGAQAQENRLTACFPVLDDTNMTIIHDKESDDKKEGEEEPDCD
jgi:hypothetical protein